MSATISEIQSIMRGSQSSYLELQEYIYTALGQGDKQAGALTAEIETLKLQVKQREHAVHQLEMET